MWRLLLFTALMVGILQLELLLVAPLDLAGTGADAVWVVLAVQGALMLTAALAAAAVMLRWVDHRSLRWIGLPLDRRVPGEVGTGLVLGALPLLAVVALLALFGAYGYRTEPGTIAGWVAAVATGVLWLTLPAAAEEAVFRGYAFRTLVQASGPVVATVAMSALFAVVHAANPNVGSLGLFNIFLAGVMLSLAVLWTGSLWFATAVHLGWNWAAAALLDLPVSGLVGFDPPLYDAASTGPSWLTGGAFGPEGGLAGTAAAGVAVAMIGWYSGRAGRAAGADVEGERGEQDR